MKPNPYYYIALIVSWVLFSMYFLNNESVSMLPMVLNILVIGAIVTIIPRRVEKRN